MEKPWWYIFRVWSSRPEDVGYRFIHRRIRSWRMGSILRSPSTDSGKENDKDEKSACPENPEPTKGVILCAWVMAGALALNVILSVVAAGVAYSKNSTQSFASTSLYQGKCAFTKNWVTGIQLVINLLSTAMLGASSYCMQWLVAPSRAEVDEAHRRKVWMTIGVPNIPALILRVRGERRLLGLILLVTSLPIHLIYNSAAYYSLGPSEYKVILAQAGQSIPPTRYRADFDYCVEEVLSFNTSTLRTVMTDGELEKLSRQECIDKFAQDYVSGYSALFLMTNTPMPENEPFLSVSEGNPPSVFETQGNRILSVFPWMCNPFSYECRKDEVEGNNSNWALLGNSWATPRLTVSVPQPHGAIVLTSPGNLFSEDFPETDDNRHLNDILSQYPHEEVVRAELNNPSAWENSSWAQSIQVLNSEPECGLIRRDTPYEIDHCLALPTEERCRIVFNPLICLIVISCSIIKLVCIRRAVGLTRNDILLTIGDAISSFLTHPDPATDRAGLLSKSLVEKGKLGWRRFRGVRVDISNLPRCSERVPRRLPGRKRWAQAVGLWRWVVMLIICALILAAAALLLHVGLIKLDEHYPFQTIWAYGLGEASLATIITAVTKSKSASTVLMMVFLANSPQLLVSMAYFLYNALITGMLLAAEYDNYAVERKPLRVSWPRGGHQRSTYYLSLPYRYSFPLLGASALLHWLVSQSIFFVEVIPFDNVGLAKSQYALVTCGYSPVAIIFAIVLGVLLILAAWLLGLRRFRSHMPLAVHCSAAISASCHPVTAGEHALKPVQWGEVKTDLESYDRDNDSDQARGEPRQCLGEDRVFHCTFTSDEVEVPSASRLYI